MSSPGVLVTDALVPIGLFRKIFVHRTMFINYIVDEKDVFAAILNESQPINNELSVSG